MFAGDRPSCGTNPAGTPLNNRRSDMPDSLGNYNFIDYDNMGKPIPGQTAVSCEPDTNPNFPNVEPEYCSPWSDTFGFFFGDGSTHTVELRILEVCSLFPTYAFSLSQTHSIKHNLHLRD
jgi:hypothetical protein